MRRKQAQRQRNGVTVPEMRGPTDQTNTFCVKSWDRDGTNTCVRFWVADHTAANAAADTRVRLRYKIIYVFV